MLRGIVRGSGAATEGGIVTEKPWRTKLWHAGRTVGRTIYQGDGPDDMIGTMDSRELAAHVVALHNAALRAQQRRQDD